MKIHQVALPHTPINDEYSADAYNQKAGKFAKAMTLYSPWQVITYAAEGSVLPHSDLVNVMPEELRPALYGDYDHRKEMFRITWDGNHPHFSVPNSTTIKAIAERIEKDDIICVLGGHCQQAIAEAFPEHRTIEHGIGYEGVFSLYRVFESYAWMHHVYGLRQERDGSPFDAVIPNLFDADEARPGEKFWARGTHPYHAYVGRLIRRKGVEDAVEATKAAGKTLIIAGQGAEHWDPVTRTLRFDGVEVQGEHIQYRGYLPPKERWDLLRGVEAVWLPTRYVEPFGGVAVEALMTGTPVIATDWGAATETVKHGYNGLRYRTREQAINAARDITSIAWPSREIADFAAAEYGLEAAADRYVKYLLSIRGVL